jgi:hypothetical protein
MIGARSANLSVAVRPLPGRRRLTPLRVATVALAGLLLVVPLPAAWVERVYSSAAYLEWQRRLTMLANLVPIAWFDVLIVVCIGAIAWTWTRRLRTGRRTRARWRAIALGGADSLVIVSLLYLWFICGWGLNYRREPLSARLDFDRQRVTRETVGESARRAVDELNRLYPLTTAQPWATLDDLPHALDPPFAEVQRALGQSVIAVGGRPKATVLGVYFRWAAIDGMTDPFFLETLVNQEVLPVERPFIVAHEWGHLAGYAHEAEANYLGWLICQAGPPQAQYSGWLALYWHLVGSLPASERRALDAGLQVGPREDLRAIAERYYRSTPRVRVTAWAVYDRFLKANRVAEGVASYDGVVALLVGTRYSGAWQPALRPR